MEVVSESGVELVEEDLIPDLPTIPPKPTVAPPVQLPTLIVKNRFRPFIKNDVKIAATNTLEIEGKKYYEINAMSGVYFNEDLFSIA